MSARIGWLLAAAALVVGWFGYGWQGLVLGATVTVFMLLLQFSQALRVMRRAAQSPIGAVPSAVMLQAKLVRGMRLLDVVRMTGSIGSLVGTEGQSMRYRWHDNGGAAVQAVFDDGRLVDWTLERPAEPEA